MVVGGWHIEELDWGSRKVMDGVIEGGVGGEKVNRAECWPESSIPIQKPRARASWSGKWVAWEYWISAEMTLEMRVQSARLGARGRFEKRAW